MCIYSSNVYRYCDGYHHPCYYAGNCMMNPSYLLLFFIVNVIMLQVVVVVVVVEC